MEDLGRGDVGANVVVVVTESVEAVAVAGSVAVGIGGDAGVVGVVVGSGGDGAAVVVAARAEVVVIFGV